MDPDPMQHPLLLQSIWGNELASGASAPIPGDHQPEDTEIALSNELEKYLVYCAPPIYNPSLHQGQQFPMPPQCTPAIAKPYPAGSTLPALMLIHDFIKTLPADSPSPFKTEIFVENCVTSSLEAALTDDGKRDYFEMSLDAGYRKDYRVHCVMNGQHTLTYAGQLVCNGFCSLWTRKYPEGWAGSTIHETEEHASAGPSETPVKKTKTGGQDIYWGYEEEEDLLTGKVWQYSAAVTVISLGKEVVVECIVPKRIVVVQGISYDLEPGWEDVVRALNGEVGKWETMMSAPRLKNATVKGPVPRKVKQHPPTLAPLESVRNSNTGSGALPHAHVISTPIPNPVIRVSVTSPKAGNDSVSGVEKSKLSQAMVQLIADIQSFSPERRKSIKDARIRGRTAPDASGFQQPAITKGGNYRFPQEAAREYQSPFLSAAATSRYLQRNGAEYTSPFQNVASATAASRSQAQNRPDTDPPLGNIATSATRVRSSTTLDTIDPRLLCPRMEIPRPHFSLPTPPSNASTDAEMKAENERHFFESSFE